ncbi:MAG TPA: protein-glutamate O-methyltransferase CheR [Thermoanaerobaculia bacterium]|nr:protein-glutamate O-methyltransferase CheR [Thermoanaerobaculia bacterium]
MEAVAAMTQEEYLLLNELISGRFGISFPEARRQILESRLRPRLEALHLRRYWDYYLHLQCDFNGERYRLAELVTNNETYFFREAQQLEVLFGEALSLAERGGALRILSAGCSSGEEPYTLGIFARTHAHRLLGTSVQIEAIDIDPGRLAMAEAAEYGRTSLRTLEPEVIERHFVAAGQGRWRLKPLYRSGIRFAWGNLLDLSTLPMPTAGYDVIFCRNVFIYFSESALRHAVRNFAALLRPGGLLFLGASESIIGLSECFETLRLGRTLVYQRVAR